MNRVLITGTNRGLGLEFTHQYVRDDWYVYAGARNPGEAEELKELQREFPDRLHILSLDVTDEDQLDDALRTVTGRVEGLDLLINNAGLYGSKEPFEHLTALDFLTVFEVNCLGAFQVTQTFLPLLREAGGNVVFITSLMGSMEDNRSGGAYPYRVSKAALNMLATSFHVDFSGEGIYSLILHPGWVKTRLGGPNANISPDESVRGMRKRIDELDGSTSGTFLRYNGEQLPW